MAPNRMFYLAALIAAATFYFASTLWFSWVILAVALALPWLSLLASLPAMVSCRLSAAAPERAEMGEQACFCLRLKAPRALPLPELQIRLTMIPTEGEPDVRYLSRIGRREGRLALPTDHCGQIAYKLNRARVYDYLGLFWLPKQVEGPAPTVILPRPVEPVPVPDVEQVLQIQLKPKPGGGYSEIHDHRPYREGDPVRSIHWKLSMKTEDLIVREAMEPVRRRLMLLVRTPESVQGRDRILGELRWISGWLCDQNLPHTALWMEGQAPRKQEVQNEDQILDMVAACCTAPAGSLPLLHELAPEADWVYTVGGKGGTS